MRKKSSDYDLSLIILIIYASNETLQKIVSIRHRRWKRAISKPC